MKIVALHSDDLVVRTADDYLGSPMYSVIGEHRFAVALAALLVVAAWIIRRRSRSGKHSGVHQRYVELSTVDRFLVWMLALGGAIHFGLVPGHELSWWSAGYVSVGLAETYLARAVLTQSLPRRRTILVLLVSIFGYAITGLAGTVPDQLGIATKLFELAALAVVVQPQRSGRLRGLGSSAAVVSTALVIGIGAWVGAFSGDGGHHVGESAGPGTLIPRGEDREPDEHEIAAAETLYRQISAAVARYEDPDAAAADGYLVGQIAGLEYHAANPAHKADGRILDPNRPENLIYAAGPNGPVLLGVMYEMEEIGEPGPAIGGPLTVWHGHDHVCFSLTPPALAGLTSPFGVCPAGSVTVPMTGEMLHVWTVPGAPEKFGHMEEDWLQAYLKGGPLPDQAQETPRSE